MELIPSEITVREYPNCAKTFMRFQLGENRTREMIHPTGNYSIGRGLVWHLLGHGDTLEKAQAMAKRSQKISS